NKTANGAILVFSYLIVHRSGSVRSMSNNAVIDLYTATDPGSSHGDIPEFHHVLIVKEVSTGALFCGRPDLAANLRHDLHTDIIIFKQHHLPFPLFPLE